VIYRPPKSSKTLFVDELDGLLSALKSNYNVITIVGDVNLHLETNSDRDTGNYLNLLSSYDLTNYTDAATHTNGHTLDTVACNNSSYRYHITTNPYISDHSLIIHYQSSCNNPKVKDQSQSIEKRSYEFRDFKSVDTEAFCKDVADKCRNMNCYDINSAARTMFEYITSSLDAFAPIEIRKSSLNSRRYKHPWSKEISEAKKLRRKYERLFSKSKLQVHKQLLKDQTYLIRTLVKNIRAEAVQRKIKNCSNSKELFSFYNSTVR
jgi:hypothetical protein